MTRRESSLRLSWTLGLATAGSALAGCDGGREAVEVVSTPREDTTQLASSDTWSFVGGARLTQVALDTADDAGAHGLDVDAPIRLRLRGEGVEGCEARVFASPPRTAARQTVWRGPASARPTPTDPRVMQAAAAFDAEGAASLGLELPRPWFPRAVTLELELWCDGARRTVRDGPRRELRPEGRRVPGARAVLGVFAVQTGPPALAVPRASPNVDGRLAPGEWPGEGMRLVDSIDGEPVSTRPTTVWLAWDDAALYVGARARDPDLWSEFDARDDPLWEQEVFEVFVAGPEVPAGARAGPYLELQVSPAGVVFDARFADYRDGDPAWDGAWTSAVALDGTLNDRRPDIGWSVEVAIPWSQLCEHVDLPCPVHAGQALRLNAFRFERIDRKRPLASALSPTRATDFHAWANAARITLTAAEVPAP